MFIILTKPVVLMYDLTSKNKFTTVRTPLLIYGNGNNSDIGFKSIEDFKSPLPFSKEEKLIL
ncbi:hypothetical protein SAMN05444394_4086 [Algoriphagus halophilus]|uniref:Uncharacterized protein n=1 Tax=Algoriphagus halophilus TaxID=226505 RepID=A0A1N6HX12_9BACT|nr:hypothetical protein SAMN05444394_4086 [Algoriphagus halophilus]